MRYFLIILLLISGCASYKGKIEQKDSQEKDVFTISRTFETDRKTLFEMWTNPKIFSSWLGPTGAKMSFMKANVKEGRTSQWEMTTPDGLVKYGKINYKIISPYHHLLVYTQNFCDKDGNPTKLPIPMPYPDMLLTTISFIEESAKKVHMTVKWEIFSSATDAERQTFNSMKPIMATGWGQSFNKIDSILTKK